MEDERAWRAAANQLALLQSTTACVRRERTVSTVAEPGEKDDERHGDGEEVRDERAGREQMEVAHGEEERADPRGDDHAEENGEMVPAPHAAFHRPAPEDARKKGVGRGERLQPALDAPGGGDDDEDEAEGKLEAGGEKLVGVAGKDDERGEGEAVVGARRAGLRAGDTSEEGRP